MRYQKDIGRPGQNGPSRNPVPVDAFFQGGEDFRDPLDLVQDKPGRKIPYEPHRIGLRGLHQVEVVKGRPGGFPRIWQNSLEFANLVQRKSLPAV